MFRWLRRKSGKKVARPVRSRGARLMVQGLEGRVVPATFTVTNADNAGAGSLRQAIQSANAAAGADDIAFDAAFFATPRTITLTQASGQLSITGPVTIAGPGAANLTVDGDGAVRVFNISDGSTASSIPVVISGLTVTGGEAGPLARGGGIFFDDENLTLDRCVITGNHCEFSGGGVGCGYGTATTALTVRNCTISGNTADFAGGGLYTAGIDLVIENSTVSGNTTDFFGGGIAFFGLPYGPNAVAIRNCTIAGNTAEHGGGVAIYSVPPDGFVVLVQNSTITGNTATSTVPTGTNGNGYGGGGLAVEYVYGSCAVNVASTVISGNASANGSSDISVATGVETNVNFSAVGDADGFTPSTSSGDNLPFGTGLGLGTLANNGGPTETIAFAANSPLRNAGSNPAGLTTDQRGPGFLRSSGGGVDIGAFEVQAPRVSGVVVNAGQTNAIQRSRVTSITVTFDAAVTFAGPVADAFTVSRLNGGAVGGFTATANVVNGVTVVTLSGFTGAETEFGSLADGRFVVQVRSNQVSAGGQQLDGDGNGTGGDDYTLNGTAANGLFRLFGDADGDGTVNAADFGEFRPTYGSSSGQSAYLDWLDIDGNGVINAFDYGRFRNRFGSSVP